MTPPAKAKKATEDIGHLTEDDLAMMKVKRAVLGNVRFIGELYKAGLLSYRIMNACVEELLSNVQNPEEEEIECLCRLLMTVGPKLERELQLLRVNAIAASPSPSSSSSVTAKPTTTTAVGANGVGNAFAVYAAKMRALAQPRSGLSSRIRFLLLDVIELRERGWGIGMRITNLPSLSTPTTSATLSSSAGTSRSQSSNASSPAAFSLAKRATNPTAISNNSNPSSVANAAVATPSPAVKLSFAAVSALTTDRQQQQAAPSATSIAVPIATSSPSSASASSFVVSNSPSSTFSLPSGQLSSPSGSTPKGHQPRTFSTKASALGSGTTSSPTTSSNPSYPALTQASSPVAHFPGPQESHSGKGKRHLAEKSKNDAQQPALVSRTSRPSSLASSPSQPSPQSSKIQPSPLKSQNESSKEDEITMKRTSSEPICSVQRRSSSRQTPELAKIHGAAIGVLKEFLAPGSEGDLDYLVSLSAKILQHQQDQDKATTENNGAPELLTKFFNCAIEAGESHAGASKICALISRLLSEKLFFNNNVGAVLQEALCSTLSMLDDLVIDIPLACKYAGSIMAGVSAALFNHSLDSGANDDCKSSVFFGDLVKGAFPEDLVARSPDVVLKSLTFMLIDVKDADQWLISPKAKEHSNLLNNSLKNDASFWDLFASLCNQCTTNQRDAISKLLHVRTEDFWSEQGFKTEWIASYLQQSSSPACSSNASKSV